MKKLSTVVLISLSLLTSSVVLANRLTIDDDWCEKNPNCTVVHNKPDLQKKK